jgi:competence protein ComEC
MMPAPGETIPLYRTPPYQFRVVAPTGPMLVPFQNDPACSLMVELMYQHVSVLDLGSTKAKHQAAMWKTAQLQPTGEVLVIGRSGAADALDASLLKPLKTRVAVIRVPLKGGKRPAPELLARLKRAGVKVYRTDTHGRITVETDGATIWVKPERGAPATVPVR